MQDTMPQPARREAHAASWRPRGPLRPHEALYFLHIPKTAGRSVAAMLSEHFPLGEIFPCDTLPQILARPPSELERWRLYCGHFGKYLTTVLGRRPVLTTFVRDPIARSISHYRDMKLREDVWLYEWVNNHSFDEFVLDEVASVELVNLQTRYLALDDIEEDYFGYSRDRLTDPRLLHRKYADTFLLDRALETLENAAFVGVQERFDESLQLLAATFGWRMPAHAPRLNVAREPFDMSGISPAAMERLEEITSLDRELYRVATERFSSIAGQITREHRERAYADAMLGRERLGSVKLGFEQGFEGEGWLPREQGPDGVIRRWTGPGTVASMDLPLRTDGRLRLRFLAGAQAAEVLAGVRVVVNGVGAPLSSWRVADAPGAKVVFDAVLAPEVLRLNGAYTRLEFHVPRTVTPAEEIRGSTDQRSLGLFFHWLEIVPDRL